jgi:hypothetical protein
MTSRLSLLALLVALLSGCYESKSDLLDPAAAVQPMPLIEWNDSHGNRNTLTLRPNGRYDYENKKINPGPDDEAGGGNMVLLNPLAIIAGHSVFVGSTHDLLAGAYVYGALIASKGPNNSIVWSEIQPDCDDATFKSIASHQGPAVKIATSDDHTTCEFADRAALLAALTEVVKAAVH